MTFRKSSLIGTRYDINYWSKPAVLFVSDCSIDLGTNITHFVRTPVYSIGDMRFSFNTITGANTNASLIELYDARKQPTDSLPASISFTENTVTAPLKRLVDITDTYEKNDKSLTITSTANKLRPFTELVNTNGLRAHWKASAR